MAAISIARLLFSIVSCPRVGPLYRRLIGSLVNAAGKLPALSTLTKSCASSILLNPPLISPRSVIRSLIRGAV